MQKKVTSLIMSSHAFKNCTNICKTFNIATRKCVQLWGILIWLPTVTLYPSSSKCMTCSIVLQPKQSGHNCHLQNNFQTKTSLILVSRWVCFLCYGRECNNLRLLHLKNKSICFNIQLQLSCTKFQTDGYTSLCKNWQIDMETHNN